MNWNLGACLALVAVTPTALVPLRGETADLAPQPRSVLSAMERVGDWQLSHPSAHPTTDWTQAAGDTGLMALAGVSGQPRYRQAMLEMGRANGWRLGPRAYHADDHCVGQTYAELFLSTHEPALIADLRARFDSILGRPSATQSLEFTQKGGAALERWSWCDALFMAPPAWTRLYAATGDDRYLSFAISGWWATSDFLYDKQEHLFFRDSTYFAKREPNGRKIFWSRGNGWVMAGLVRVLESLPTNHPDRPRFEGQFTEMAERVLTCQQPDGLWRASLLDPEDYPMQETSGSGFYAYALAWGVNQGLLDHARFSPAVHRAWAALASMVDPDGKLTHVQPIGADPKKFEQGATEVYGVGAFLLAGSEVYRLAVMDAGAVVARVAVTNSAPFYRWRETVEVDAGALAGGAPLAVMDAMSSRVLDSQLYSASASRRTLLFQVDLAPGETRIFPVVAASALAATPTPAVTTFARQVAERFNDVAWESDRIAHRMYSQELIKGEGTISSGVDVWVKRTRLPVIDGFYARKNYHEDAGQGLDDYQVGRSRGCGGIGIWNGGRLFSPINFKSARIISSGPVRSEFELTFQAWDAGGRKVSETRTISIDAGSNMSRVESVFSSSDPTPLEVAVGIAERADPSATLARDEPKGWMAYWQAPDRDRGSIGCAVVLGAGRVLGFKEDSASVPQPPAEKRLVPGIEGLPPVANALAITEARVGEPLTYYLGAGWSRSGDFADAGEWEAYVARFAERKAWPLRATVNLSRIAPP